MDLKSQQGDLLRGIFNNSPGYILPEDKKALFLRSLLGSFHGGKLAGNQKG